MAVILDSKLEMAVRFTGAKESGKMKVKGK
jgi:hypothetical protein